MNRKLIGWSVAAFLALLAWGGGSVVSLLQRVATVEAEQRGVERWLERIDSQLETLDAKIDRLLNLTREQRALPYVPPVRRERSPGFEQP